MISMPCPPYVGLKPCRETRNLFLAISVVSLLSPPFFCTAWLLVSYLFVEITDDLTNHMLARRSTAAASSVSATHVGNLPDVLITTDVIGDSSSLTLPQLQTLFDGFERQTKGKLLDNALSHGLSPEQSIELEPLRMLITDHVASALCRESRLTACLAVVCEYDNWEKCDIDDINVFILSSVVGNIKLKPLQGPNIGKRGPTCTLKLWSDTIGINSRHY
jgi:hypothetical protein